MAQAWNAPESALRAAGLDGAALRNLLHTRTQIDLDHEVERVRRLGAHLVSLDDPAYPEALLNIPDSPPLLYVKGTLAEMDATALAVVGTRKATPYGRDAAYQLSRELAAQNVTIISGLAQGIDERAHRGALDGGGRTIAVLGSGIDKLYPMAHSELARQIAQSGAVISEFPLGTPPEGRNFPRRNRIISGLSLGVLIVEAPIQSGALITAVAALDQGRDVFAVPGSIYSQASAGTNRLIQEGAALITCADDILGALNVARTTAHTRLIAERVAPANPTEQLLLENLSAEPLHIDDLARISGLPITVVSSTLTLLELKGLAQNVGTMQYCLMR
jgi:DNA processing protein